MAEKKIWGKLFSLFLCFTLALPLAGCGGGGSSSSPSSTPTSVSGVVADGYLVGATVFSDRNGNKKWDDGEPKAVTGQGGKYTLEGEDVDKYPVVVVVEATVVDEDTNTEVGKKYILTAPAGRPDFISPMTTLIQQQMERNPVLSAEEAEQVVKGRVGASEGVSLFEDYVAGKDANTEYDTVHKVARVVASTLGNVQAQVELAAETAGYTPEEVLDALVDIVVQRVMEKLSAISVTVSESGESYDPDAISGQVTTDLQIEKPISPETIDEEIEQAETPVVVSSFKALLEGGGTHWLWSDKGFNGNASQYELEYGVVTLETDGKTLAEEMYEYDFASSQWVSTTDDSGYVLVDGEWIASSEGADGGTISFNPDGSAAFTQPDTGMESKISVVETDLSGKSMAPYLGAFSDFLGDPAQKFPAGAKAYRLGFTAIASQIEMDGDSWFTDVGINFDDLLTRFAKGGSERIYISREISFQLGPDGTVDIFNNSSTAPVKKWTSTWSDLKIAGQTIWQVNLPSIVKLLADVEGEYLLIKWTDGTAQEGEYRIAGVVEQDDFEFNKIAFDAFMANLDLAGDNNPTPAVPGPRNLAAFFYGSTDDGLNVFAEAVTGASDYILYTSTDGINFQKVNLSPSYFTDTGVLFDHFASQDIWLKMTAMVNGAETEYSNTIFVEHDGRTTIDDIITLNVPATEGQVLSLDSPFEWTSVPGAQSYFVLIEANEAEDDALAKVAGTAWQYGDTSNLIAGYFLPPLVEGASYGIAVGAVDANGTIIGTSPNIDFIVSGGGFTQSFLEGETFMEMETGGDFQMLLTFSPDGTFVERGESAEGEWVENGEWSINPDGTLRMSNVSGHIEGFERTVTLTGDFPDRFEMDYQETDGESGSKTFRKTSSFSLPTLSGRTFINQTDGASVTYDADGSGFYVRDDGVRVDFTWSIQADGSVVMARAGGRYDRVYRLYGGTSDQFEIGGYEANESGPLEGVYRDTMAVGEAPVEETYSTADLAGTWS